MESIPKAPSARDVFFGPSRTQDQQREIERRFFTTLRMPNGTFKTTSAGRLAAFDDLVVGSLDVSGPLELLDVGVASGVTTHELVARLRQAGYSIHAIAVDQYLHAKLVSLGRHVDVLISSAGELLQLRYRDYVRLLPQGSSRIGRIVLQPALNIIQFAAKRWGKSDNELDLVALEARVDPNIDFVEQDITVPVGGWRGRFQLIRAANVLNLSYFSPIELRQMLNSLSSYLSEGGLLAICRTDDSGRHHGSIFRRSTDGMRCVRTIGRGSEVADLLPVASGPAS